MTSEFADQPILILGAPRSGTSMVAGCLGLSGCWSGETVAGGRDNPKGFYEHTMLREAINKPLLKGLGCDPLGVASLPSLDNLPEVPPLRDAVLDLLEQDGYDGSCRWMFKEPKLSLLWPVWHAAFPDAVWVVVKRPMKQIVRSCLNTGFMSAQSTEADFWEQLVTDYWQRLDRLASTCSQVYELDSSVLIEGNLDELKTMTLALELNWNEDKVMDFIEPGYWQRQAK